MSKKKKPEEIQTPEPVEVQTVDSPVWQLALGTIYAPKHAFLELTRRRMLGSGLLVTALLGLAYMVAALLMRSSSPLDAGFTLGTSNMVTAIGTVTLTAMLFQWMAVKFARSEGSFVDTLTVLGWSNVIVLIFLLIGFLPKAGPIAISGPLLGAVIAIMGLRHVHKLTPMNTAATYVLAVLVTAGISPFAPNIIALKAGQTYVQMSHPSIPSEIILQATFVPVNIAGAWMAVLALIGAAAFWPKITRGEFPSLRGVFVVLAVAGVIGMSLFTSWTLAHDPITPVDQGFQAYERDGRPDPALAARRFDEYLAHYPGEQIVKMYRAHALAASGDYVRAEKDYRDLAKVAQWLADTGTGTMRYFQGDYKAAAADFEKVTKAQPNYAEAQVRLSLAKLRLGDQKAAIDAAEKAIDAKYKGYLPYLVLAQAYTVTGDAKKAKTNIEAVTLYSEDTAKRVDKSSDGWSKAIETLSPLDLRMPLELPKIVPEQKKK